jgi:hypothetical protein
MRTTGVLMAALLLFGSGSGTAGTGAGPQLGASGASVQPTPAPAVAAGQPSGTAGVDASSVDLPCIPVAAYWTGPPQSEGMPPGPDLAVVDIDVRPKDARVHLDERFVGRARYFDGNPGYLYLVPGTYRLELRLDGYRTVGVDLDARAGCRYDLKHRLERVQGAPKENKAADYGKGIPFNRVFEPIEPAVPSGDQLRAGGADPSLRPDLGASGRTGGENPPKGAALKLTVNPDTASISIDGAFVATARELARMEGPLAVPPGGHVVEVSAPGFQTTTRTVELADGQVMELGIDLKIGPDEPK